VRNERDDAAFVVELVVLAVTLVVERDEDAAVQERQLAKALGEDVEAEDRRLEHLRIRLERDLGAALFVVPVGSSCAVGVPRSYDC